MRPGKICGLLKTGLSSFVLSVCLLLAPQAEAQTLGQVVSPVLTIDREALFTESAYGRRVVAALDAEFEALAEETRGIEEALEAEERSLTALRETITAEEFRALADAFDEKVVALRADRDAAQTDLVARLEAAQLEFYNEVLPILGQLMRQRGAVAVLDVRNVFLAINGIDVTQDAITLIDQRFAVSAPEDTGVAPE